MAKKNIRSTIKVSETNVTRSQEKIKPVSQSSTGTNLGTNNIQGSSNIGQPNQTNNTTNNAPTSQPQTGQPAANPAAAGATPTPTPTPGEPDTTPKPMPKDNPSVNPSLAGAGDNTNETPGQPAGADGKPKANDIGTPTGDSDIGSGTSDESKKVTPVGPDNNNVKTPQTTNNGSGGTTGLGGDGDNDTPADKAKQDATKAAEEIKKKREEDAEKKLAADAGGGSCWWIILGILVIILIFVIATYGSVAIDATQGGLGKSASQPSGKNYDGAKKVLQAAGANLTTSGGGSNKYKQLTLTDTDKNAIKDGKIDKRLLDMLVYLTKLHSYLNINHIVYGYQKSSTTESGADRSDQITANISAHVDGLAADISEIDYVYRVNEPSEVCQNAAAAALCGPFALACKQAIKESELGDLVYYASDEVKIPADIIPANIKDQGISKTGQDPAAAAAIAATTAAQTGATELTQKIDQSKAKIDQIKTSINKTKDNLMAKKNQLAGLLAGAQGTARQTIQDQITLLNANIDQVDAIVAKLNEYQGKIGDFSGITSSLQTNLGGIGQTINKYTTYAIPQIKVDTGVNTVDARIQGLIAQSTNKITDASPLQGISGIVNGQIAGVSQKIGEASGAMTQFSNSLDPILAQISTATSQIDSKINLASSTSNTVISQADLKPIGDINTSVASVGTNPVLSQTGASNIFGQLDTTALGMTGTIKNNINTAISSGINVVEAPVDQVNGLANGKIDMINEKINTLVGGLNGIRNNFVGQANGVAGQPLQESEILTKINGTISKAQSILQTITTLRSNLGNFVSKVTALQSSLSTIGNAANTVADVNKFTTKVGIDTSAAGNIAKQIDKINKAITASLTKVNGILTMLDEETANLTRLLADMQRYTNAPATDVSKYIDTLTPSLDRLDAIGHIDILSALNIDLSPLDSLTGIINGYIDKIKKEAFEKIQAELQAQLTKVIGENIGQVIGSQIPGLSLLGLGGGVENQELARYSCMSNKLLVTPSDTKLGGNSAVIVPLKVEWQELSGLTALKADENPSFGKAADIANYSMVLMPETRKKVHELLTQTLQFPYDMKDIFYYKANQIITFSAERDVQPFWEKLKDLYGTPRGENIGLFAMPEALPHVHVAY